ncbi:MAG: hypothetical protein ACI8RZ_005676, partial [Myxococcota bacterium]
MPDPPDGARNYVLLILDSCRFDALVAARPRHICRLGEIQRRFSYATWTAPSHYNLLMGLLPHPAPTNVFASAWYQHDLARFAERLGIPGLGFEALLPRLWLPTYLRSIGYHTRALVSMPVLNPATPLASDFDSYASMERHNDLAAMLPLLRFSEDRPTFYLLNTGETHYPYAPPGEPEQQWPRIHGVHGVFKRLSAGQLLHTSEAPRYFNQDRLDQLRRRQILAIDAVDAAVEQLFDVLPDNTWVTITSDHGELFGEEGYFGHGPIPHR